jgi:hypothetical protein
VEVILTLTQGGYPFPRTLLADTGAGSRAAGFDLVLPEAECLMCGGIWFPPVPLGGTYLGSFPLYELAVGVPALGFNQRLFAVGVPSIPVQIAFHSLPLPSGRDARPVNLQR